MQDNSFKEIEKAVQRAVEKIEAENIRVTESICENAKKAANYQAEYDALMNQKRTRTLSTHENKRARILKSNIDYYKTLREEEFNDIKVKLQMNEISEEQYYSRLAALRDAYFQKGSDEWNKYTIKIIEYNRSVIEEQQKEIEENFTKSYENILKKQESVREKLDDNLKIYETVQFDMGKGQKSEWLRLANIDEDLQILKNYNNSLLSAKEKANAIFEGLGLDDEKTANLESKFFEQIATLSIGDAIAFSNHINFTPDDELTDFITKWVQKVDLSEAISKNLYADETDRLMENYAFEISESFADALNKRFENVPDTFFSSGVNSALEFKNGFLSAINDAIESINIELNNKISALMPDLNVLSQGNSVTNNSNYNIYGTTSPAQTALEIYKQDEKKKMLVGG